MNFKFYLEKLHDSSSFKNFKKEDPDAFLCSCFFVIDKEGKDDKTHFDFYTKDKKFVSFQLEQNCQLVPVDVPEVKKPNKLPSDLDLDFTEIARLVESRMSEEKINNKIQKLLFSLQNMNGKISLNGTVFISMLGLIRISIDIEKMEILDFEKKSFFDMMKFIGKGK